MKRFLFSAVLASTIFTVHMVTAAAYLVCFDDPLVSITTPSGNTAQVWVTEYAWTSDPTVLQGTTISYTVQPVALQSNGGQYGWNNGGGNAYSNSFGTLVNSGNGYSYGNQFGTQVKISVTVPATTSKVHTSAIVSMGPNGTGQVLAAMDGSSGQPMVASFVLSAP